jgi:hypothetical protein
VGPLNGDAAAYLVSAPTDRWTHAAWAFAGQRVGFAPLTWLAAVVAVAAAVALTEPAGRRRVGWAAAAVVVPWAAFPEVDLPWAALVLAAAAWRPALAALAVAISPTALLALPWLTARTRSAEGPLAAVLAVGALTIASHGAWWTGTRGVLHAEGVLPGRGLANLAWNLPWLLLLTDPGGLRALPWLVPLAFAPTDTPAWLVPGVVAAASCVRAPRAAVFAQLAVGWLALGGRGAAVRGENEVVARVAAELRPGDGVVAPWTWGARVAVARTGDPYGWPWHPPDRFLQDQARQWCDPPVERVWVLPSPAPAPVPAPSACPGR